MRCSLVLILALLLSSCGGAATPPPRVTEPAVVTQEAAPEVPPHATMSIVGTNDLHGHIRALPLFAGYLANLRAARTRDRGAVLLLDGGDMFQGTLESNLEEGASVVRAYEVLGYDAVTIGNHEFDYGPIGPRATPRDPGDDPRGALRARIEEAEFPFLSANLLQREGGARAELGLPSVLLERAGLSIGVIGVTTEQTLTTTIATNVADLAMRPLADAITAEAQALRARGAAMVVVTAHAGGHCERFDDPDDLSSCDPTEEIFEVARALTPGTVDAIVGGHTHQAVAHRVNGIPIIEAYSYGIAFGRVDLVVDRASGRVVDVRVMPPQRLCGAEGASPEGDLAACAPGDYEGAPVVSDARVAEVIAPSLARADSQRHDELGPTLTEPFAKQYGSESALGNLFVDLMLRARPDADAAIINGGGLRADLPAGPLRYGALYEAFPFDNRFAMVRMRASELAAMIAQNLARGGGYLSLGGVRAEARCVRGELVVSLTRDGRRIRDAEVLDVLASDFLVSGGDGAFAAIRERDPSALTIEDDPPIREAMAEALRAMRGQTLASRAFFDPEAPRVRAPGARPVSCESR
ncbi:bifunctional metallophosphatase/5'-nucleotidase [Sandaracinus amylolyticus]|uniref:bifunctional metallophosphatase/5'-nucleotidase n=1 Tax=Sandaracinus amylolyticus TaxID=927083 RepID=UPI001F308647|nr:bifunctional UDP-sugar hydrolase/5'-nucleotidase [Sandaracinus amylolyticus]UJR86734.1 Hypothetical protein I5071_88350 [Sandaracinus amylolyticus]